MVGCCGSCCSAHTVGMINTGYANYDSFHSGEFPFREEKNKRKKRELPIIKRCLSTFSSLWPMTVCGGGEGRSRCRLAGFLANARIVLWEKKGWGQSGARRLCDNKSLRLHLNARDFSQHKAKCPLDVSETASLPLRADLEQNL